MTSQTYVTLFAGNYAEKALAMVRSLGLAHGVDSSKGYRGRPTVYVLCMDDAAYVLMERHRWTAWQWQVNLERVHRMEIDDQAMLQACRDRDLGETCWSYGARSILMALQRSRAERVTYLDADTFFFSDPAPAFEEMGERPITIVPHRFPKQHYERLIINGKYNVNWVSVTRSTAASELLRQWDADCVEWCYRRLDAERGRMGDQLYWDRYEKSWPVYALQHVGVGTAPWNAEGYLFGVSGTGRATLAPKDTAQFVPLIQYHFHEFEVLSWPEHRYRLTGYPVADDLQQNVYEPYIKALQEMRAICES